MLLKKTIVTASIILASGCATGPWDGMPYQQATEWQSIGVSPMSARSFMANGFSAVDAKPWVQLGVQSPQEVVAWHRAGFSPAQAKKWIDKGFSVQQAQEYKAKGLTIDG